MAAFFGRTLYSPCKIQSASARYLKIGYFVFLINRIVQKKVRRSGKGNSQRAQKNALGSFEVGTLAPFIKIIVNSVLNKEPYPLEGKAYAPRGEVSRSHYKPDPIPLLGIFHDNNCCAVNNLQSTANCLQRTMAQGRRTSLTSLYQREDVGGMDRGTYPPRFSSSDNKSHS